MFGAGTLPGLSSFQNLCSQRCLNFWQALYMQLHEMGAHLLMVMCWTPARSSEKFSCSDTLNSQIVGNFPLISADVSHKYARKCFSLYYQQFLYYKIAKGQNFIFSRAWCWMNNSWITVFGFSHWLHSLKIFSQSLILPFLPNKVAGVW